MMTVFWGGYKLLLLIWVLHVQALTPQPEQAEAMLCGHNHTVQCVALHSNFSLSLGWADLGEWFRYSWYGKETRFWHLATGSSTLMKPNTDAPEYFWCNDLKFSPNGEYWAIGSYYELLITGSAMTGEALGAIEIYEPKTVSWSPDSQYLYVGQYTRESYTINVPQFLILLSPQLDRPYSIVRVEDCPTCTAHINTEVRKWQYILDSAFSPDSTYIAELADHDGTLRVRNWDTNQNNTVVLNDQDGVIDLDWKGSSLVTASSSNIMVREPDDAYIGRTLVLPCPKELLSCRGGAVSRVHKHHSFS